MVKYGCNKNNAQIAIFWQNGEKMELRSETKNAKILVADEDARSRGQICEQLRRAGFRNIEEAANGEEALIKIGRSHPDVALVDVWLSKIDGIGVLENPVE